MKLIIPLIGLLAGSTLMGCTTSERKITNSDTIVTQQKPAASQTAVDTISSQGADLKTVDLVKRKLAEMFKDDLAKNLISPESRKFTLFEYNTNADPKKEIFVGLTGPYFCGSGGCTLLLLDPEGKLINKFTVTDYPITIADTSTNDWKDLVLTSNGKDHLIKFNGKAYPSNPSLQPIYSSSSKQNLVKGLNSSDQVYAW